MIVGFTGTSSGMSAPQKSRLFAMLGEQRWLEAHHGDCVGADAEFHAMCRALRLRVIVHPPILEHKRARCDGDVVLEPQDYLIRNRSIVDSCSLLVAAPKMAFEELRSGTWATIRYARKVRRQRRLILPSGEVEYV